MSLFKTRITKINLFDDLSFTNCNGKSDINQLKDWKKIQESDSFPINYNGETRWY